MLSRPLAIVLFVLGCLTAAAGGSYLALRHNQSDATSAARVATEPAPAAGISPASHAVAETEAVVSTPKAEPMAVDATKAEAPIPSMPRPSTAAAPKPSAKPAKAAAPAAPVRSAAREPQRTEPMAGAATASKEMPSRTPAPVQGLPGVQAGAPVADPVKPIDEPRPEPRQPQFDELIIPAAAVIGLQVETPANSERARVEDRIDARVSRDVMAGGRVAIPAGSRVMGSVVTVERGGKMKEQARLGIRFHTLVLADGTQMQLHTDPVYRLGEPPAPASSKKIGGAAIGGAILGAILGGGKGAAIGGATGAAGGTAAVMAGDRNPATLRQGEYLNVKLASPATITVERREQ